MVRLAPGQSVSLGNSIGIKVDGTGSFTIAAWINFPGPNNTGSFLSKGQQFQLSLNPGLNQLNVKLGAVTYSMYLAQPVPLSQWVYLVVTFQSTGANASGQPQGVLSAYLSGVLLGQSTFQIDGVQGTANFTLGGDIPVDFLAVAFYSEVLDVNHQPFDWQPPAAGPTLAAVFSFANGRTTGDLSGHGNPVTFQGGAQQYWVAPGVSLANAAVQPAPADQLNPGGDTNSFSVLSWACVTGPSQGGYPQQTVLGNGENFVFFGLQASSQNDGTYNVVGKVPGFTSPPVGSIAPGVWHHLGMTYDTAAKTMSIYIDGQQAWTGAAPLVSPFAPAVKDAITRWQIDSVRHASRTARRR